MKSLQPKRLVDWRSIFIALEASIEKLDYQLPCFISEIQRFQIRVNPVASGSRRKQKRPGPVRKQPIAFSKRRCKETRQAFVQWLITTCIEPRSRGAYGRDRNRLVIAA